MAKTTRRSTQGRKSARRRRPAARPAGERALAALRQRWNGAVGSLSAADAELRRQVLSLKKETTVRTRALNASLADLQARARKETRAFARSAEASVTRALAALNIPTRHEVDRLTRRVEELSRKLDGRRPARAR